MSAPRTNIETEKRRHAGPLIGMGLAVIFGVGLIVYWQFEEVATSPTAESASPVETGAEPAAGPVTDDQ